MDQHREFDALYLEPAFADLNRDGIATPPDVIKHITPLGWQHISLYTDRQLQSQDHCGATLPSSLRDLHMFSKVGQIDHFVS